MEEKQRKTGERSSFAMTCSLLSQYLKDNWNLGELGIEKLHCSLQEKEKNLFRLPTTMNLFLGLDVSTETDTNRMFRNKVEDEISGQLTIFYDGKVMVFDNFPAKKDQDLMEMASKSVRPNSGPAQSLQRDPKSSEASRALAPPPGRRPSAGAPLGRCLPSDHHPATACRQTIVRPPPAAELQPDLRRTTARPPPAAVCRRTTARPPPARLQPDLRQTIARPPPAARPLPSCRPPPDLRPIASCRQTIALPLNLCSIVHGRRTFTRPLSAVGPSPGRLLPPDHRPGRRPSSDFSPTFVGSPLGRRLPPDICQAAAHRRTFARPPPAAEHPYDNLQTFDCLSNLL
ncbi:hypothetical protein KFK09_029326 [Dendrobium nobile]|uniref:Protein TIFY n=1 Tax=Dendrobium nobile TaxID=94219 RepID=A0A8T3A171_DENNO|nr:hypothetical protein KFK09_029326 [Dendrobium nobile]